MTPEDLAAQREGELNDLAADFTQQLQADFPGANLQLGPNPVELRAMVEATSYKPGWRFRLVPLPGLHFHRGQGCSGLTLCIEIDTLNSYMSSWETDRKHITVSHFFHVPPAAYGYESWRRWLFEQVLLVERHEAMEFFEVDHAKPFAPNHGPGENPYRITELTSDEARRTSFRGDVKP